MSVSPTVTDKPIVISVKDQSTYNYKFTNSSEKQQAEDGDGGFTVFDQIFDSIKHYGRYQFMMLCVIQYIMLNSAGNYIFISFAALRPKCQYENISIGEDTCADMQKCSANNTISMFHSLYEEENFVCPNSYLPHHLQTFQAFGSAFGAILGGHLADYFGRKWVTYSGALFMFSFGMLGAFSPNWIILAIAMFGMGLAYGILIDACMTLASETVGPRYRIVQTLAFQWSFVMQIAALIAYLSADWRKYLFITNILCAPALVLMLFWRESPRWLIQRKRLDKACKELTAISSFNGCTKRFEPHHLMKIEVSNSYEYTKKILLSNKIYSLWDLFSTKKFAAYSMVMIFSALTVEMCVGVVIFDIQVLAGNPFLNIALYGMLRIWVPFFIILMDNRSEWFGRRILFLASQSTTVICYVIVILLMLFIPSKYNEGSYLDVLRTVLLLVGGVVNSGIFFTIYKQFSMELYPTLMRAIAVGTFGVIERIGGALAPQLISMNSWTWQGTALTITAAIALLSLITGYVILPETKNVSMPDIFECKNEKQNCK